MMRRREAPSRTMKVNVGRSSLGTRRKRRSPRGEIETRGLAVIPPARGRTARRAHHHRQRKTDAACDQQRAERIVAHGFCDGLRAALKGFAAVLVSIPGEIAGGLARLARSILGLAVE